MIYCFFLAVRIYISTLRQQQQRGQAAAAAAPGSGLIKLRQIAGVRTFFALLDLWSPRAILTMPQRVEFVFSLLGI